MVLRKMRWRIGFPTIYLLRIVLKPINNKNEPPIFPGARKRIYLYIHFLVTFRKMQTVCLEKKYLYIYICVCVHIYIYICVYIYVCNCMYVLHLTIYIQIYPSSGSQHLISRCSISSMASKVSEAARSNSSNLAPHRSTGWLLVGKNYG